MENTNVLVIKEKPPPRKCPRCNSKNTKFCYYNNYNVSQPRYNCKNCRRYWTLGGSQRNIPIDGSRRKTKRAKVDQPDLHVQETNEFVGSFGNNFGFAPEVHCDMVSFSPMDHLDIPDGLFQQDYYNVGSIDMIGNDLINQFSGRSVVVNSDQNMWNQNYEQKS